MPMAAALTAVALAVAALTMAGCGPAPTEAGQGTPLPEASASADQEASPAAPPASPSRPSASGQDDEPGAGSDPGLNSEGSNLEFGSAAELFAVMGAGWSLGNTLDAWGQWVPADAPVERHERAWGNPQATEGLIRAVHAAGFSTLRVPVTWHQLVDPVAYQIRDDWLDRVAEVVGWGYDLGMVVILNTHHDEPLFSLREEDMERSAAALAAIWTQIAERFAGHGGRLVFEGLNEPRTIGTPGEWRGGTPPERRHVNVLNQVFVDTVRAAGGLNAERILLVPTYGAAVALEAFDGFELPNDPAGGSRLAVSLHLYAPWEFTLLIGDGSVDTWSPTGSGPAGPAAIDWALEQIGERFLDQGIPVVLGETGAVDRGNPEARAAWAEYFASAAAERGLPVIWWDNGRDGLSLEPDDGDHFALFDRLTYEVLFPEIVVALVANRPY
ncbi:MAG: glycoside hydrolase family 5 protein [Promicromonosporaceae bacterium]|nr:glycoside hydrolase family 5 protein [Promicromonosporaceae bacterium]